MAKIKGSNGRVENSGDKREQGSEAKRVERRKKRDEEKNLLAGNEVVEGDLDKLLNGAGLAFDGEMIVDGENEIVKGVKIEGTKKRDDLIEKKVEVVRKEVAKVDITGDKIMRWNLLDGEGRLDEKGDKMKKFLEYLGRNLDTYGENNLQLGWFGGENLVQYVRKFGKGLKGKNLMSGAMKMKLELADREINQVDTADEILRERERKDDRADHEFQNKRGRWDPEVSDEEFLPREMQNPWRQANFNQGQTNFNQGQTNFNQGQGSSYRGRDNSYRGRENFNQGRGQNYGTNENWVDRQNDGYWMEIDENILMGYKVIEKNFCFGVFGLETTDKGERCFAISIKLIWQQQANIKGLWNTVFRMAGGNILEIFDGGKMAEDFKNFINGGKLAACCNCESARGLYKFRNFGMIWGTKNEKILVLRISPMGASNLGLRLKANGHHRCWVDKITD